MAAASTLVDVCPRETNCSYLYPEASILVCFHLVPPIICEFVFLVSVHDRGCYLILVMPFSIRANPMDVLNPAPGHGYTAEVAVDQIPVVMFEDDVDNLVAFSGLLNTGYFYYGISGMLE